MLAFLFFSCEQKKTDLSLETFSDQLNKFQIDIPDNWQVEKSQIESLSIINFADTTKMLENVVVYQIYWEPTKIYMNAHFERSMDSIVLENNQEILNQSFDSVNDFKIYRFDAIEEYDSLNKVRLIHSHNYLKNYEKKGHLVFIYSRVKEKMSKNDSIITKRIMNTIRLK